MNAAGNRHAGGRTAASRAWTIALVLLLTVAVTGCGGVVGEWSARGDATASPGSTASPDNTDEPEDDGDFRTGPIPSASPEYDENALPDKPPSDAPPAEQIAYKLLDETSQMAGVVDPGAKATCPPVDGSTTTTVTCPVVYRTVTVSWKVEIKGGSGSFFTYKYSTDTAALAREHAENYLRYVDNTEQVFCDMDEVALVPVGRTSDVECRAKDDGEVTRYYLTLSQYGTVSFDEK